MNFGEDRVLMPDIGFEYAVCGMLNVMPWDVTVCSMGECILIIKKKVVNLLVCRKKNSGLKNPE